MKDGLTQSEILKTVTRLHRRIVERFKDCDLEPVARELLKVVEDADSRLAAIRRPAILLRLLNLVVIAGIIAMIGYSVTKMRLDLSGLRANDIVQAVEATISSVVFLGAAIVFLVSIERRNRERKYIAAIYDLRILAHMVDIRQLAMDPDRVGRKTGFTESSPRVDMSVFLLGRYLDYASELLSMISKIAAWYAQGANDARIMNAVDEVEGLCTGLSRKIWQKIIILDRMSAAETKSVKDGMSPPAALG